MEYRIVRTLPGWLPACHVIFVMPCTCHVDLVAWWPASGSSDVAGRVQSASRDAELRTTSNGASLLDPPSVPYQAGLGSSAGPAEAAASSAGFEILRTQPLILTPCA